MGTVGIQMTTISQFLTAASCPKKDFYTPPPQKAAKKHTAKHIPEPVLLLS